MSCLEQARRNVKKSDIYMGNCRPATNIRLLGPYIDKSPTAHYKIHVPGNPGNELSGHYDHLRCQIPNNRNV